MNHTFNELTILNDPRAEEIGLLIESEGWTERVKEMLGPYATDLEKNHPISPLLGGDEFVECYGLLMNKRLPAVYMEFGKAYYQSARIWRTPDGILHGGGEAKCGLPSTVEVTFPFVPKSEIVDVTYDFEVIYAEI